MNHHEINYRNKVKYFEALVNGDLPLGYKQSSTIIAFKTHLMSRNTI